MSLASAPTLTASERARDGRGSWMPTGALIGAKVLELRRRRGLMVGLAAVTIGLPTLYFTVRLIEHAASPRQFGPAGGYQQFTGVVVAVLYVFGFIMSATLGCTAGTADLGDGMFRHLVVTGRSRLALYFARIPAALAIMVPMVTAGFIVVAAVSSLAAPSSINVNGAEVPLGLNATQFQDWAAQHSTQALCNLPQTGPVKVLLPCGARAATREAVIVRLGHQPTPTKLSPAQIASAARALAASDYPLYRSVPQRPPWSLLLESWAWVLLESLVGVVVGVGLSALLGQRTIAVVLLLILEVVLTPIASRHIIPYMLNVQRGVIGVATAHLAPHALTGPGSGTGFASVVPESRGLAWLVVVAWLVGWTALGAWRMARRDA